MIYFIHYNNIVKWKEKQAKLLHTIWMNPTNIIANKQDTKEYMLIHSYTVQRWAKLIYILYMYIFYPYIFIYG